MSESVPILYALHSGQLYGTERMALATLDGLTDLGEAVVFAPPGPLLGVAREHGFTTREFSGAKDFAGQLWPWLRRHRRLVFFATGVVHSLALIAENAVLRRRVCHLHLVHGGTDERLSYGRKRLLNGRRVRMVAVSAYVRERLLAHRVADAQIDVVENFLTDQQIADAPRRAPFTAPGIARVSIVSRVDPIKRVDLLLTALDRHPRLRALDYRVYGTGWDLDALRERARRDHPNVHFEGFSDEIPRVLAASDLLLHLCPSEPFGLAMLEAMAARIPVVVPDRGGAAGLIEPEVSGFRFAADDPDDLARTLLRVSAMPAAELDRVADAGHRRLSSRYSASVRIGDYRRLIADAGLC